MFLGGCATPFVQPAAPRQLSPALYPSYAIMADGYRLPLSRWRVDGKRRAILLALHGLNDYRHAFDSTGEYLARRGIEVVAYDQRGFGESDGHGLWHGSERMVEDLRVMIELLRDDHPTLPLYLLGESMGGAVVLAASNGEGLAVDGMVLVAPAIWSRDSMPCYQRWALWLFSHFVPAMELTCEGLDLHPSDNIAMLQDLGKDPLVIKETRVDVLYGMSNLMDLAVEADTAIPVRMLILYGQHDDIIPRGPTCRWLRTLPGNRTPPVQTLIYRSGYHMLIRDLQAGLVLEDIVRWISGGAVEVNGQTHIRLEAFCATGVD